MRKLHIVVYKSFADVCNSLTTRLDDYKSKLYIMCDLEDYQRPVKRTYKDGTVVVVYKDCVTVFVKYDLPSKQIGMLEYYIFRETGLRGDNIKIDSLEVFEKPNTPLKKYLIRKI